MSYLQQRVFEELKITPQQQKIKLSVYDDRYDGESMETFDIFSADEKDNIKILTYNLNREPITYFTDCEPDHPYFKAKNEKIFYLIKKNPANMKEGENKYLLPKGAGTYPFFSPNLIKKYEKKQQIKTLVLTEGYFKAMKASLCGFDIVGLSSITHHTDKKTKAIHSDIGHLIKTCKVKNVVMLYDGDCLNLSDKALESSEDLAKRPNGFVSSMLKLRELLLDYDIEIFFAHVQSDNIEGKPKGLDDVLVAGEGKETEILEDLMNLSTPGFYFYRLNS